jgi:hypothetical protein
MLGFRIASIMTWVLIAALDLGVIRAWFGLRMPPPSKVTWWIDSLVLGALPVANVLVIILVNSCRRRGPGPFVLGFEAFGVVALLLYVVGAIFLTEELVLPYVNLAYALIEDSEGILTGPHMELIVPFIAVVMLSVPQIGFALIGGFIFRRFRATKQQDHTR